MDGQCRCSLPWEGGQCEVDARDKFVGSWQGTENCNGAIQTVAFGITKSAVNPMAIIIDNQIRGELKSSTTFDVPSQQFVDGEGNSVTVNGNGSLNGNALTLNLTFTMGGAGATCIYNATRQ